MAELKTLTLDGFLEEQSLHLDISAPTFSRTLPRTLDLPEITVGLAVLIYDFYKKHYVTTHVPEYFDGESLDGYFVGALIWTVENQKKELFPNFPNWQERFLLDCGYAYNPNATTNFKLFEGVPEEQREFLLRKHGLHRIATMVAYGHTWDIDATIEIIDRFRGDANYGDVLPLMTLGVPCEDWHSAAQLPTEMVKEIYDLSSGGK